MMTSSSSSSQTSTLMEWGMVATITLTGVTLFSKIPGGTFLSFFLGILVINLRKSNLQKKWSGLSLNTFTKKAWTKLNHKNIELRCSEKIIGRRELIQRINDEIMHTPNLQGKCKLSVLFQSPLGAGLPYVIDTFSEELLSGRAPEWINLNNGTHSLSQMESKLKNSLSRYDENIFIIKGELNHLENDIALFFEEILLTGKVRLKSISAGEHLSFENSILFFIHEGEINETPLAVELTLSIPEYNNQELAALFLYEASKSCKQRGIHNHEFNPEWVSGWVKEAYDRKNKSSREIPLKYLLNDMKRSLFSSLKTNKSHPQKSNQHVLKGRMAS